jgi:GT2 family glycosyltransferase
MDDDIVLSGDALERLLAAGKSMDTPAVLWPSQLSPSGREQNYPGWYATLLSRSAVERAGLPRADLVWWIEDTEYLQRRVPASGVGEKRVRDVRITHGDARPEGVRPAWKTYYETRNTVWFWLYVRRNGWWRFLRVVISLFVRSVTGPDRAARMCACIVGCAHGLVGHLGQRWPLPVPIPNPESFPQVSAHRLAAFVIADAGPDPVLAHVRVLLRQSVVPDRILVIDVGANDELRNAIAASLPGSVEYLRAPANVGRAGAASWGLRLLTPDAEWVYWGHDDQSPETDDQIERLLIEGDAAGAGAMAADRVLVVHRNAVARVGTPVPEFFGGLEDVEYVARIRRAGLPVVAPPDPRPQSYLTVRNSLFMVLWIHRNRADACRLAAHALGSGLLSLRHGPRHGLRVLADTVRGLWDGWWGVLGPPLANS